MGPGALDTGEAAKHSSRVMEELEEPLPPAPKVNAGRRLCPVLERKEVDWHFDRPSEGLRRPVDLLRL
jgi:hypothetical protein